MADLDRKAQKAARDAATAAESLRLRQQHDDAIRLTTNEAKFWESPYGQARTAKASGDRFYQIELAVDSSQQGAWSRAVADIRGTSRRYNGQGAALTAIEQEGWELIHAGFVFKETGQVSRDKFLSSGQQVSTWGQTVGVYLFRATEAPPRTDEYWRAWQ